MDGEGGTAYFGYDVAGNTDRVLDALDRSTYFGYDKLDRLTKTMDALSQAVYFGYDLASNQSVEMDALSHSTYYGYDQGDRLTTTLDSLGKASYYGYDENSNLARTLDNNNTSVYFAYDGLDRRFAIAYPSQNQYFAYDAISNLTQMTDIWGATYFPTTTSPGAQSGLRPTWIPYITHTTRHPIAFGTNIHRMGQHAIMDTTTHSGLAAC